MLEKPLRKPKIPWWPRRRTTIPEHITANDLADLAFDIDTGELKHTQDSRDEKLCKPFAEIDFKQFGHFAQSRIGGDGDKVTSILILLDQIIKKRETCDFCGLLFDSLCRHDPFQHPEIKQHLPDNLTGKTFQEWVEGQNTLQKYLPFYNLDWPFGTSKDDHKLGAQVEDEEVLIQGTESEDSQFGADEFAVGATFLAQASLMGA
ncbi:hypothetical protein SCUP515_04429 [Seiridium cupressi]